nr:hypothetical protein CFP56_65599 [Quercus suber]
MLSVPEIEEVFGQKRVELSRTPIELNNSYWILKVVPWIGGRIISMMHLPSVIYIALDNDKCHFPIGG